MLPRGQGLPFIAFWSSRWNGSGGIRSYFLLPLKRENSVHLSWTFLQVYKTVTSGSPLSRSTECVCILPHIIVLFFYPTCNKCLLFKIGCEQLTNRRLLFPIKVPHGCIKCIAKPVEKEAMHSFALSLLQCQWFRRPVRFLLIEFWYSLGLWQLPPDSRLNKLHSELWKLIRKLLHFLLPFFT